MLINQINALWNDLISVEDIVNELIEDADEQNTMTCGIRRSSPAILMM